MQSTQLLHSLHPELLKSYSLYRKTLRVLKDIKIHNEIQKGVRSKRVAVKIPSGKLYHYAKTNLNEAFRKNKEQQIPISLVQYYNQYRMIWILKGFEKLKRDASQPKFVKLKLRLSPQLNIIRQALFGYGNQAFKELLIRSFIVEAQNTPFYVIDKKRRGMLRRARKLDKLQKTSRLPEPGYMVRHITSDMTEQMIENIEKKSHYDGEEELLKEMIEEEIEIEKRIRERL